MAVKARGDVAERIARATEIGGNRLKASLLLRRWAGVLRSQIAAALRSRVALDSACGWAQDEGTHRCWWAAVAFA